MNARLPLLLVPLLVGCPPTDDDDATGAPDACEGIEGVSGIDVALDVVTTDLSSPVHMTHAGDGSGRVFVVEQGGEVLVVEDGSASIWLDIDDRVNAGGERGLLSIAFHSSFSANGRFFASYTGDGGTSYISEFGLDADGNGDPDSERVVLQQSQPAGNHNGGQIAFGPDGYLYIGFGDGGGAGDTYGNGQNPDTFLAKILRIDVDSGDPYGIPSDNPFVGDADHLPETWAWGLRNPWRFSFDRETGTMWIADVGQGDLEEISLGAIGGNFGWPEMEGNSCYTAGCNPSDFEPAVHEYSHSEGISITGGFVYRGCTMPDLHGNYFFSDYNYFNSPLWTIREADNGAIVAGDVTIQSIGGLVSSFGEDEAGEIYLLDHSGGRLLKIVPAS
ncbi:MAG: PQQ-dependent sugar dehydrogenase [Proteobacteria bacterium]|nr:PQQ-dependent sugar dehydrogenase [Pseudomonadota bacterium]